MKFERRVDWHITFIDAVQGRPLARSLTYRDATKIVELARRGGHPMNLEGRQALDMGISNGLGSVTLKLNREQYAKLTEAILKVNPPVC